MSKVCSGDPKLCQVPSCSDSAKNGDETAFNCGGSCSPCPPLYPCLINSDCLGGACQAGICQPTCEDGALNGAEADRDCGGPCAPCRPNRDCFDDGDCTTAICSYAGHGLHCQPLNSCSNGQQDGSETDVDCGGPFCGWCTANDSCLVDDDCQGTQCEVGVCQ